MLNYIELIKELEKKDEYIITKLSIYYELSSLTYIEKLPAEDVAEIVEYLHNIYLSDDELSYHYPKIAKAASEVCHYDLQELLSSIRENSSELQQQILDTLFLM